MEFEEFWEDFGIRIGPLGIGLHGLGKFVRYSRTEASHILRIRIDPEIKKGEIKARLVKPGLLEIEWPRKVEGEEVPIE
ncbi:MAG: hypothetical protein HY998_01075 [candidate division NC10 bacterium]|nr:hypothetical protein [candidate division NC10 bacterium]